MQGGLNVLQCLTKSEIHGFTITVWAFFTPLKYVWGVYLEFKIINDYTYPKNVIYSHTSDINKLDSVNNKSDHGCEIGK